MFLGSAAQVISPFENREERQIYTTDPNGADDQSILDATNPMDLMNRIRQSAAMDNATDPSKAIGAALETFQQNF